MKILADKQAVLLKLRQPERVTTVIPTAKHVRVDKEIYLAVPHRPDETRVLRQLGFDVPAPMQSYYAWPGQFKPFGAQKETSCFLSMHSRAFCLNSMGLGKTMSALWAYDYLRGIKQAKRALVIAPLSTLERTWADEIFKSFPHLKYAVLYGSADRRKKLLKQKADVYIINTDGIKTVKAELAERPDIDLVVVDESALYRNQTTDRWKALNEIVNRQCTRRVWALTGSPTPNEPTDAWAQCRVVVPTHPAVPKYFRKFRDQVMRQVSTFKWVPRSSAVNTVKEIMQPAIRYALDDVVDLPPQVFITREVAMTPEQHAMYKDMLSKLATEYQGAEVTAVNEAVKAGKLLQIACGVAYGNEHNSVTIPAQSRIEELKEIVTESEGKVIVFVPFTAALEHVAAELGDTCTVAVVHGETKKNVRDQIFSSFQKEEHPRAIVANPGTMSHGLTLTAATTVVWYSPVYSNEIYEQACARVRRPGQTRTTVIVHIAGSSIERRIYERLKNKQKLQGALLDLIKQEKNLT